MENLLAAFGKKDDVEGKKQVLSALKALRDGEHTNGVVSNLQVCTALNSNATNNKKRLTKIKRRSNPTLPNSTKKKRITTYTTLLNHGRV